MEVCTECEWPVPSWRALQIHRYIKHGKVAQGKTMDDGTYIWECNKCEGNNNPACDWCYGLNTERIIEEMQKGARGQRYYALLKAFLSVQGKAMVDYAKSLDNKLRVVDLGQISLKFGLNFKATVEWLEETRVIRSGSYDRFKRSGLKVTDVMEATRQEYPVVQGTE
jgi:hypothetical protein